MKDDLKALVVLTAMLAMSAPVMIEGIKRFTNQIKNTMKRLKDK